MKRCRYNNSSLEFLSVFITVVLFYTSLFASQPIDDITRALILSLGVCYHARLQNREPYRKAVATKFVNPCQLPGGARQICKEITR